MFAFAQFTNQLVCFEATGLLTENKTSQGASLVFCPDTVNCGRHMYKRVWTQKC